MARPAPPPPRQPSSLDEKIWQECAGGSVEVPKVDSLVYYFPQGHLDQATSRPRNLSSTVLAKPCIPCRVVSLQLLADPHTDEVFAKQTLHPVTDYNATGATPSTLAIFPQNEYYDVDDEERVVSFPKILTPSDANNGGGFSVPRSCAEAIFPPLDFQADPPVQNIHVTDVHGSVWQFRHIYRGTPLRHLLTSGWSTFVNAKKLVAGDSVVFMKNSAGQLFVGIRRATRFAAAAGLRVEEVEEEEEEEEEVKEGFKRDGKGKLSAKVVAEAAELAAMNMPFEVVYYPKAGWSEFVVKAEVVDKAMRVPWSQGLRVKISMKPDNSSRVTWSQGTVSSIKFNDNGPWRGSPWLMLQITWDEPEVVQNANWVSPWQVELVSPTPSVYSIFPPMKKFRAVHGSGVFTDGEGNPFSMTGFSNSAMGNLNQTLLSYPTFPAGMQGARHDLYSTYFPNYPSDISRLYMGNSVGSNTAPRLKTLSTELNVGSFQSNEFSPDSGICLHSYDTQPVRNQDCNSSKPGPDVLQLFGIRIKKPVENGLHGIDSTGDDDDQC